MKKRILSMILTLSLVITLLPAGTLTASAADSVYDGNYSYVYRITGSRNNTLGIPIAGVYLIEDATITTNSIGTPAISIESNGATLVIKGNVTLQGANGNSTSGGGAGILVPSGYSVNIVGYAGTTNSLTVKGGNGGNAANGANGVSATEDESGAGGEGGTGGGGGGAAIGTNGGNGYTNSSPNVSSLPCGTVAIDTSNLTLNLNPGSPGSAGAGGNGGSSNGWSVIGSAARAGGGGGGGGGAGYRGQPIGTGGQGGFKGAYGGNGANDTSHPCYAGGGGGGAGGNGSTRGGGGGGGGRAIAYSGWGGLYTCSGAAGGQAGQAGSNYSIIEGSLAGDGEDGLVFNGRGGYGMYGGAGGSTPSNGVTGNTGASTNEISETYTSYKTICFNANGGSASTFTMVTGNTISSLPANNPTRADYTFKGWATSKTATTPNVSTTSTLGSTATTFYAVWERDTYDATITVKQNGNIWMDMTADTNSTQVVLSTSDSSADTGKVTGTFSNGVFTFSEIDPSGTMYVWAKNSKGAYVQKGSVSASSTSATVDYYYLYLNRGTGIASVTGSKAYLSGETANISATLSSGYTWSKWSDNDTTMTGRVITVDKSYDLTANAVAIPATAPTVSATGTTLTYGYTSGNISVTATPAAGHTITGYQWYTCGSDGSNKAAVSGATSSAYNIPTGKDVGSYYYVCDVTTTRTDNSQTKTVTTSPATLVTVNKKAITVTMKDKFRIYGEANPTFDFTTSDSLQNSDTITALAITGATTATQTSNVGTYVISGTSTSTNYDVTINEGTLTINKKTSESTDFTYDSTSKTYNGDTQGVSVTPKSGAGTITAYYEGVSPTSYTKSTTPPTMPGTYKITIDVSNATNYLDISNLILGNYIINKADVGSLTLTSSKNPSTYEDEVTFTGAVTKAGNGQTPTGTIMFKSGGATLASITLVNGVATFKSSDLGAATHTITAEYGGDSNYIAKTSAPLTLVVNQKSVDFTITGQEQVYDGTAKGISIDKTGTWLTKSDFTIKYYLINENEDILASTTPVTKAVSPAKYLYVIDFAGANANYKIENKFEVANTTLPTLSSYDNVGYMMIKSQTAQQKPIYFGEGIVNKLVGDHKFTNQLTNGNASTVTYSSTNTNVATINSTTGEVTILKDGSTTIMAKSTLSGTADVFANYSLVVTKKQVTITAQNKTHTFGTPWDTSNGSETYSDGLSASDFSGTLTYTTNYTNGGRVGEYKITPSGLTSDKYSIIYESATLTVTPKTLTASDFNIAARDKVYDGTVQATLNANIISGLYSTNIVKPEVEGAFTSVNASDIANVTYKITGLTGKDADNYVLDGGSITGSVAAKIEKATVSIICASNTTKTFDGNAQTVDVSAMANGTIFGSSNYTVKYNGKDSASSVGIYPVTVVLNDDVKDNYIVKEFTATLTIIEAVQDVFSIENVPDRVYYGDKFKVMTQGTNGTVTYSLNQNAPATIDAEGNVVATGTGTVTVTATSTKEGYTPKIATRTFAVYPRVLTPTVAATDRVYNTQNDIAVTIGLENILSTDDVTAAGLGVMANADAGTDKIVYVSNIKLSGNNKDFYALATTTLQTSVNIDKASITGFTILAGSKKYDGTNAATATVDSINGIFDSDKDQVSIIGNAVFNDKLSSTGKTITFTANDLTGAKAGNYKFVNDSAKTAIKAADIIPLNVNFTVGTATFKYDGEKKKVAVSGADEMGRVFSDYTVEYWQGNIRLSDIPSEAGNYTVKFLLNDNINYTTTQQDISLVITQASQEQITIVGLPSTIEYTDKFTLEAIGGSGTGNVVWTSDKQGVTVDNNGFVSIDGSVNEKVTITVTKKDDSNFTEKSAKVVFIPTAKTVSFALDDLSQTYDENDKQISVTPSISNATYDVTYNGLSTLPVNAGIYNVIVTANGNYKGTANTTLTIGKAKMSGLNVFQNGCTYGERLVDATFDAAPRGVNVRVEYSTFDGKKPTKAGDYIATATYTGDNYETFVASNEFKIEKKILTVKANDKLRKYGETNPVFTLIYDGFVNDENASVLLSEPVATTIATASSPVNDYEITVSGGRADNYSFSYNNNGKLKVTGAVGGNFYITGSNNSVTVGDIFKLHAYYDNAQPKVEWVSSDNAVVSVDESGVVKILKQGEATITATIADTNYESGISAAFKLNASKKTIQLKPSDLVKVYDAERQDITLVSDDANFVPTLSGENKNIDITYTLTTDSSVTEPKQAGTYTVTYSINHPSYTGGDTVTMYINKANVTITAHNITKVYGQINPAYSITGLIGADEIDPVYIAKISNIFAITSDADATGTKTNAGAYPITLALKQGKSLNDDLNYNLVISDTKGALTVTKAPLEIKVSDAQRAYSEDNKNPEYEYIGFVNGETEADLTNKPVFTYDASITKETNVGMYPNIITASGAASGNYEISYSYTDGTLANLTVTPLPVTISAGSAKSSYITVAFDKAIAGLTKDNFVVTLNGIAVNISSATAGSNNTAYTLRGDFTTGSEYSVTVTASSNYAISGSPLSVIPRSSGGSGGGGGGGSVVITTYTITVTQVDGGKISPETISVNKNENKTFTITPNEGYEIEDVLVNGKSVGKANEYTFEKITSAGTITAKFKKIEPEEPVDPIPPEWENPFTDVNEKDWFYEAVKFVNENGFMMGITSSVFDPNSDVTRTMFVTVLYRIENEPNANTALFNDLEKGAYYEKAVSWASENGIVKGISETQFAPNENITREQMAAIVYRYAKFKGYDILVSGKIDYTDNASISDYANDAVVWASNNGIMTGNTDGSFAPQDNSTRAEIADVLQRIIQKLK